MVKLAKGAKAQGKPKKAPPPKQVDSSEDEEMEESEEELIEVPVKTPSKKATTPAKATPGKKAATPAKAAATPGKKRATPAAAKNGKKAKKAKKEESEEDDEESELFEEDKPAANKRVAKKDESEENDDKDDEEEDDDNDNDDGEAKTQRRRHEASHTASDPAVPSGSMPQHPTAHSHGRRHDGSPCGTTPESAQYWPPHSLPVFSPSENMSPDEVLPPAGSVTIEGLEAGIERLLYTLARIQEQQNVAMGELQKLRDMCQQLEAGPK
ncbi:uncharacterized protein LOC143807995 isoform X3 [Ranitomeya variabilis]|uniref:uncharacterized protein LOC143807995 isoform X3 n=1 Tax=Ranitomeya variabilis TaxID=490064 RepID=UPI0040565E57